MIHFTEALDEVMWLIEPREVGDLCNGQVTGAEQVNGFSQTDGADELIGEWTCDNPGRWA